MVTEPSPRALLRFGMFELDERTGELRRQGVRIRIQEQPLVVLRVLLDRSGTVVTRDELRAKLWGPDTFVDFDNSLNTSVNKLRDALGDSADNPRFIETIPKRGYRFIAPVTVVDVATPPSAPAAPSMRARRVPAILVTFALLLIGAVIVVAVIRWPNTRQQLAPGDRIVVAEFANRTGDGVFDGTLRQGLSVELEQSPSITLLPESEVRETLRLMKQPDGTTLTADLATEVCQRAGATIALTGSIAQVGSTYDLLIRAANCASDATVASTEQRATDKNAVLDALTRAASAIRSTLGESQASIDRFATPLMRASTPSIDALRSYSLGYRALVDRGDSAAAAPPLREAISRDPNFAMAYSLLGDASWNLGEMAAASDNLRKAYDLRGDVSQVERLRIEANYYSIGIGDLEQAMRAFEAWAEAYPQDCMPRNRLGVVDMVLGQYEKAQVLFEDAEKLCPHSSLIRGNLTSAYIATDRIRQARDSVRQASASDPDSPGNRIGLYRLAFLDGDTAKMRQLSAASAGTPGIGDQLLWNEAATAAYAGEVTRSRELTGQAAAAAERSGESETAATYTATLAHMLALVGIRDEPERLAQASLVRANGSDLQYQVAVTLAIIGDSRGARQIADDLAGRFPSDTIVQTVYVPTIRAHVALSAGNPAYAINLLQAAVPYERGAALYPAYLRGVASLAMGRSTDAIAEFEKVGKARGAVLNNLIGALARVQLARAYAAAGAHTRARAEYEGFFALWKNADAEIPLLRAARDEYRRLE